jgi:hypothetical protein
LASSVLSPGDAIHPVAGSIFSGAQQGVFDVGTGLEEIALSKIRNDPRRVPGFQATAESPAVDGTPEAAPPLERPPRAHAGVTPIAGASSATAAPRSAGDAFVTGPPREAPPRSEAEALSTPRSYRPLVAGVYPSQDASEILPSVTAPPAPSFNRPKRSSASSSQNPQAATPPDEIQIHIGRVEVIAMPPAPARTAPAKPSRQAPSLNDYLRRRDGGLS